MLSKGKVSVVRGLSSLFFVNIKLIIALFLFCFCQKSFCITKIDILKNSSEVSKKEESKSADIIIISENNPKYLHQMVESIFKYVSGFDKIFILKDPCYGKYRDLYESIKAEFNEIEFIKVAPSNFKSMLESLVSLSHNKHVILSRSNIIFTDYVDLDSSINAMEKTKAQGFYFSANKSKLLNLDKENEKVVNSQNYEQSISKGNGDGKNLQPISDNQTISDNQKINNESTVEDLQSTVQSIVEIDSGLESLPENSDNIFMWQFKNIKNLQKLSITKSLYPQITFINNLQMTMYKKDYMLNVLNAINYDSPVSLEQNFNNNIDFYTKIYGLSFAEKKLEIKNF